MIQFTQDYVLSIPDMKQTNLFVRACTEVYNDSTKQYRINYRKGYEPIMTLMAKSLYDSLLANLDSSLSNPVLVETIQLNAVAAGTRAEEVFRLVAGSSEFPGTPEDGPYDHNLNYSGFERKIWNKGAKSAIKVEVLESVDSGVKTSYPLMSTANVSAISTEGELTVSGAGGSAAELILQDLTYTSVVEAASGDNVQVQYFDMIPAVAASLVLTDLSFTAVEAGVDGNDLSIEFTGTATLGSESVTVDGDAITVDIAPGQTSAALIANLIQNDVDASALILCIANNPAAVQQILAATNLSGGADAIGLAGAEVVIVQGTLIQVWLESGVSTATQVQTAVSGNEDAALLVTVTVSGDGENAQIAPIGPVNLAGGHDAQTALNLGELILTLNGAPIDDGTQVEVSYETLQYTVYELELSGDVKAVMVSDALVAYLTDNAMIP